MTHAYCGPLIYDLDRLESLQSDVSELQNEREHLMKELENEKQRCHTLEQTLADLLGKDGQTGTSDIRTEEINSISRKLATLEIKVKSVDIAYMLCLFVKKDMLPLDMHSVVCENYLKIEYSCNARVPFTKFFVV